MSRIGSRVEGEMKLDCPKQGGTFITPYGAVAQLVERFHGMEEVRGSIPLSSTTNSALDFNKKRLS